jgi:hypothetical protein
MNFTPEQWARWAVFGDTHNPRVIPETLQPLVERIALAIGQAIKESNNQQGKV